MDPNFPTKRKTEEPSSIDDNLESEVKKQRKRAPNFTPADKILLTQLVEAHDKNKILGGQARSAGLAKRRKDIWTKITEEFNVASTTAWDEPVTMGRLIKLLCNIKASTRDLVDEQEAAMRRMSRKSCEKTGGGEGDGIPDQVTCTYIILFATNFERFSCRLTLMMYLTCLRSIVFW